MSIYQALTKDGRSITSVIAGDKETARVEIHKTLSLNPMRKPYLEQWVADGEIVTCKRGVVVATSKGNQVLQEGHGYWLGATEGVYDVMSDTFNLGNCFVTRAETVFAGEITREATMMELDLGRAAE